MFVTEYLSNIQRQTNFISVELQVQTSRSCITGGSCEAFSSESSEKKEAARSKTESEDEVGLWKCATIELMSDEEDGIVGGVSGWIVRPPSFRSQELTERHISRD
ncbi:hypothetical protein DPX16_0414 [Anabarilius grahami]|uniref:Uncharacterized protein n=1 Tax=Anabarilius grahami TaxID=495550 RepID=A0A3N0XS69_ANAGA|nr:hypothetical protein DPX16_0414 [Anabarilius grahami]